MFVVNVDWFFISHRIALAENAIKKGYRVTLVAKDTGKKEEIIKMGIQFIDLNISRSGTNLFLELLLFLKLFSIYLFQRPNIIHHVTLKPVIYGSIVAKILKIKGVVNAISGLGYTFTGQRRGLVKNLMINLMKFAFNDKKFTMIFQNRDDYSELQSHNILSSKNKLFWIKGSGINLSTFQQFNFPNFDKIVILFPTRMLWDKGVKELYEATVLLKNQYKVKIQFVLAGMADEGNRAGVPLQFLTDWQDGEYVKWVGYQTNMVELYKNSHVVVLPSYREGLPKTLIEACSIGRAIITTDAIGCKDCVDEGINGYKVPVNNSIALAKAIELLVNNPIKIREMGIASRFKAEKEFDIDLVIESHFDIYNQYI